MERGVPFLSVFDWLLGRSAPYAVKQEIQPTIDAASVFPLSPIVVNETVALPNGVTTTKNYTCPQGKHRLYTTITAGYLIARAATDSDYASSTNAGSSLYQQFWNSAGLYPLISPMLGAAMNGVTIGNVIGRQKGVYVRDGGGLQLGFFRAAGADGNVALAMEYYEAPMTTPFPAFLF